MQMTMAYCVILLIICFVVEGAAGESKCSVTPHAVAVIAGNYVSLTCTASSTTPVVAWSRGTDYKSASVVYQTAVYGASGSVQSPRILVDGYFVDNSNVTRVILMMNNTSTVQADRYYCSCYPSTFDATSVTVVESEPTFSKTMEITDGELVTFTCSVSFNGSANVSFMVEYPSEKIRCTKNYDRSPMGMHNFSSDYHDKANSSIVQEFFCTVTLTSDLSPTSLYSSRRLNVSVQWLSVRSVHISPVDITQCLDGKRCALNQTVRCVTKGNPKPLLFRWITTINGSHFTVTEGKDDRQTLNISGYYAVQCTAFNEFLGRRYNSSSTAFKTQVVTVEPDDNKSGQPDSDASIKTAVIAWVVVGVGGALIIVLEMSNWSS